MLVRSALVFALATAGCTVTRPSAEAPPAQSEAPADVPSAEAGVVRITLGEAVAVENVPVRFDAVTEDSRCPPDVSCVWAGRAHVRLVVGETPVELSIPGYGPSDAVPSEASLNGLTVRAQALAPAGPQGGAVAPMWVEVAVTRS